MPGPEVPQPPPENVTPTGGTPEQSLETSPTTHPLKHVTEHLSDEEREQALTGTHPLQQSSQEKEEEQPKKEPEESKFEQAWSSGKLGEMEVVSQRVNEAGIREIEVKIPGQSGTAIMTEQGGYVPVRKPPSAEMKGQLGGTEPPQLYIADASGQVREARAVPPPVDRLRPPEIPPRERGSLFEQTQYYYTYYSRIHPDDLPPADRPRLEAERARWRGELVRFKEEADQGTAQPILEHVRVAAVDFLRKIRLSRPQERHGGADRETIIRSGRQGYYQEVVFDDSPQLKQLENRYGGLARYIFDGIVQEIDKEASRRPSYALNALAEEEYREIKRRRERERPGEQKYTETPAYWGGRYYELLWPESSRDMIDSTLDWVKDRISEIGNRDVGKVNNVLEDIRGKVVELLESCRTRLNGDEWFLAENKKITETDPNFLRARYFGEGVTDVLGNEKVMYKGNIEYGPQYKDRFASEFIAHHDEMYMGNPKVAYILHKLTTHREGTYWVGHGWDVEKAEEGEIKDYRSGIEEEIVDDAAAHNLFLSDDMTRGLYLDGNGDPILSKDGRTMGAFTYREGGNPEGRDLRFSFDDNIETLLLDPGNQIRQEIIAKGDPEALRRHDLRVAVFRRTREELYESEGLGFVTNQERRILERQRGRPLTTKELMQVAEQKKNILRTQLQQQGLTDEQIEERIWAQMEEQRREQTRNRTIRKMEEKISNGLFAKRTKEDLEKLEAARRAGGMEDYDQIVWQWVKDYNQYRIDYRLPKWNPTGWDRVRWNIDRPTKVLDRGLSDEEFEAMFEPIEAENLDDLTTNQHKEDARFAFQLSRSYQIFHMQDTLLGGMRTRLINPKTGEYYGRLPDDETSLALGLIRQAGTDNEGKPIYEIVDPNRKMVRVWDVIQARIQMAIDKEAAVIEQAKTELVAAQATNNKQLIRERREKLRDLFVNSQFVPTHALKEIGLVEGKLPVWSYNFLDRSTIYAFTEVLANYGVEVAPGERISHSSKKVFYEYMERGRRALKAEFDRAAREFMVGTYPVYEKDENREVIYVPVLDDRGNPVYENGQPKLTPKPVISLFLADDDWGDPGEMRERFRVVSKGGMKENTQVTEAQFDTSTSGGVIFTEAIPWAGDLGYYPLLVWVGAIDPRELHGYIKRRDEVEFHQHKFFDVMDPVQNAKAQAAAYIARRALTGGDLGKISKGQETPGFLMEPFHGAFRVADLLRNWYEEGQTKRLATREMNSTISYLDLMTQWRMGVLPENKVKELEEYRQLTYNDFDKMSKAMVDSLYNTVYEVLDYFQWALKATKEVETNRIGNAPRNWLENNTLKWYAFRREMRKAGISERGFVVRHGYSPEVASEISIRMMETVLRDADYLILKDYERDRMAMEGAQILSRALTPQERQQGFVIPDEKEWSNQPERIRLALENIRRRGLLEFMKEEGYKIYDLDDNDNFKRGQGKKLVYFKEVLGQKIPPAVQLQKVKGDNSKKLLTSS